MKVGDYVKVVDNSMARDILSMNEVVKIIDVSNDAKNLKIEGSIVRWQRSRFEPLPILTEAPPKGSKVVKVEKSNIGKLYSDSFLGKVVTSVGREGRFLDLHDTETGARVNTDVTIGKWALV